MLTPAQWSETEKHDKDAIESKKIRVKYNVSIAAGPETHADETVNPPPTQETAPVAPVAAVADRALPTAVEKSPISPVSRGSAAAVADTTPAARKVPESSVSSSNEDASLKEALARAEAKIRTLSEELEDQKSISSSAASVRSGSTVATRTAPAGLPVSQTAILVLIAFLVGWFFF